MVSLYVVSTDTFSGKSAICVGLGRRFISDGYSVGYMKPVCVSAKKLEQRTIDEDTEFVKRSFNLDEPLETLSPILLSPPMIESILQGREMDFRAIVRDSFSLVSRGKDIVLLEGANRWNEGAIIGLTTHEVHDLLDTKTIIVERYESELVGDDILAAKEVLGDELIGAVINGVPRSKMDFVCSLVKPFLEKRGVRVLAAIPQDRVLLSISVAELNEALDGEILCCADQGDELVEHLMVGAMSVDSALSFFRRKSNKAVITGGDRPDIQLAALETSTKCIIVTGNMHPNPVILGRAEELGVPMIQAKQDTLSAVQVIEQVFGKIRFHQTRKIKRIDAMLHDHFDFAGLYQELGLSQHKQAV